MYDTKDLLTLEEMPQWSDISLSLYKQFSVEILFPKTFRYYLEEEKIIDVQFKEWAMKHIWAIQHIDGKIKNEELFEQIDNGLDFTSFSKTTSMKKRLMDHRDRIRMFACIYTI